MRNKKKILNDYKKKVKYLIEQNKLYYIKDNPKISDQKYDNIKKKSLRIRKKIFFFKKSKFNK